MRALIKSAPKLKPKSECPHYWIIEEARLPESEGICKLCGAKRMFKNGFKPAYWRQYKQIGGDQ